MDYDIYFQSHQCIYTSGKKDSHKSPSLDR
jgi:hypothetical protein